MNLPIVAPGKKPRQKIKRNTRKRLRELRINEALKARADREARYGR